MARKDITKRVQGEVLVSTRRRCALCFGLDRDESRKQGQIAHIDRDHENSARENLTFLCLPHHDEYDTTGTSQSKAMKPEELLHYIKELEEHLASPVWTAPAKVKESRPGAGCSREVYDIRIESYRIVRQFLLHVIQHAKVTREEIQGFSAGISEILFLFGPDIEAFAREALGKAIRFRRVQQSIERLLDKDSSDAERESLIAEDLAILDWFDESYRTLGPRFFAYLELKSV